MTPIIIPFRGFTVENHRTLPLVPQSPIVTTIADRRILMGYWEREVKIWKVDELSDIVLDLDDETQGRKLLSRIVLSVCSVSPKIWQKSHKRSDSFSSYLERRIYNRGNPYTSARQLRIPSGRRNDWRSQALQFAASEATELRGAPGSADRH